MDALSGVGISSKPGWGRLEGALGGLDLHRRDGED